MADKTLKQVVMENALEKYDYHNAKAEKYGCLVLADGKEEYRTLWHHHREKRQKYRSILTD